MGQWHTFIQPKAANQADAHTLHLAHTGLPLATGTEATIGTHKAAQNKDRYHIPARVSPASRQRHSQPVVKDFKDAKNTANSA